MKVHYINILLFALPLNILAHNNNKSYITPHDTQNNRSLCECELYAPANYENDQQMKSVMENFNKQTQQRLHEYDERMIKNRQNCKEKCDKDIQKIILKDKLEKQMAQHLTRLETNIGTDDIPTCICEKSMADQVEKDCLRCGYGLGTVAPTVGLIGSVAVHMWKPKALEATIAVALKANTAKIAAAAQAAGKIAGDIQGRKIVITFLEKLGVEEFIPGISDSIGNGIHYTNVGKIADTIWGKYSTTCMGLSNRGPPAACDSFNIKFRLFDTRGTPIGSPPADAIPERVGDAIDKAVRSAEAASEAEAAVAEAAEKAKVIKTSTDAIEAASYDWYATVGYSVLAILIIVLIMVIIYLILRYRRKKKMKKKLQYIKLLEE
ncbi:rifin PIR protein, putative [Plasmodium reichenowi]|uniref:Rifin PIR protein, putative n=1 Tax=Plasmodium reichenowi TaxID=5854 RepID=A0A2P9DMY6_PLARE|nr:rifin PIR protein, putative [Plasmodium reichenowi]